MTGTERAYIAGIIDGEGGIMLTKFHNNQYPAPCVSIISTTIELLQWIKEKTKVGTIKSKKNYNKDNHKDSYTYAVKYNDAIELLKQIQPYLIIETKKKRTELILAKYKKATPRNGRYNEQMKANKERFYEEFISIK